MLRDTMIRKAVFLDIVDSKILLKIDLGFGIEKDICVMLSGVTLINSKKCLKYVKNILKGKILYVWAVRENEAEIYYEHMGEVCSINLELLDIGLAQ